MNKLCSFKTFLIPHAHHNAVCRTTPATQALSKIAEGGSGKKVICWKGSIWKNLDVDISKEKKEGMNYNKNNMDKI